MTEKKRWLIITFHTTSSAIAMEKRCKENGVSGRLIPVPRSITADCGMAWRTEPQLRLVTEHVAEGLSVDRWLELEL